MDTGRSNGKSYIEITYFFSTYVIKYSNMGLESLSL